MSRICVVLALLGLAGCAGKKERPAPEVEPVPVAAPKPVFPKERSILAEHDALPSLPRDVGVVVVAASLERFDRELAGVPLPEVFEMLTGRPIDGFAAGQPVGVALRWGDEWILWGGVGDEAALRKTVPKGQLRIHGGRAIVTSSAGTMRSVEEAIKVAQPAPFDELAAKLEHGALLSWWTSSGGAAGVSLDGKTLRVRAVGGLPPPLATVPHEAGRPQLLLAGTAFVGFANTKRAGELRKERDEVLATIDASRDELAKLRAAAIDAAFVELGGRPAAADPLEVEWTVPAASASEWLHAKWRTWVDVGPEPRAAIEAAEQRIVAIDKALDRESEKAVSALFGSGSFETGFGDSPAGDLGSITGGLDSREGTTGFGGLGNIGTTGTGTGGGGGAGMGSGGAGMGRGGGGVLGYGTRRTPTLAFGAGPAAVRALATARKDRLQYCYEKELTAKPDLAATITLTADVDASGAVTSASATGSGVASLDECMTRALKGRLPEAPAAAASGSVTITLSPGT